MLKFYNSILFVFLSLAVLSQPVSETLLTNNFTDPYGITSIDFDNNTHEDLIVCGVGGIAWFSNDGVELVKTTILDSMAVVNDMEIIDFDGDLDLDILGINSSSQSVFFLENDGSMNFSFQLITDTVVDLVKMRASDMDNDGDVDMIISVTDGVWTDYHLLNNELGVFTNTEIDRVDFSRDIYAADYDQDGDVDFLTKTNYSPFTTEEFAMMQNNGDNTFIESQIYEKMGDIDVTDAIFDDIDGDGDIDLLIADAIQDIMYWLVDCTSPRTIMTSESVTNVSLADYNNDGVNDIVYKLEDGSTYRFYALQGANPGSSMSFTESWMFNPDVSTRGIIPFDVDDDNLLEFAYTSIANDEVGYYDNEGAFSFEQKKIATSTSKPSELRRADLDSDGDMDIVAFGSDTELIWLDNQADGTYQTKIISSEIDSPYQLEVMDFDEDGDMDIITASIGDDDFSIWFNDGSEVFTEQYLVSSSTQISNPAYFSIADLDNDGDKDFVIVGCSTSSYSPKGIFWIRNEGSGSFSSPITIEDDLNMMGQVITHDFDDDGNVDIVVADGPYGSEGLMVLKNHNSASYFTISQPLSFKAETIRLGDVDGDGLMDFVVRNDDDNDIVWCKSNGDLTFTPNTIIMSEARDVLFELCDDANDGDTDFFFYTNYYGFTNSADFTAGILINDGDENFTLSYLLQNDRNMFGAVATDVDMDNDIDFFLGLDVADKISFYENLFIDLIDPIITSWSTGSAITYEDELSNSILSGGVASVAGTFSFVSPSLVPDAGTYSAQIKFVPDDNGTYSTMYSSIDIVVNKATPIISTWPSASDISYGTNIGSSTLSGGVTSTTGSFTFDAPAIVPALGVYAADVTFIADNPSNYFTVSGTVNVNVVQATPTVTDWPTASSITYGEALSASVLTGGTSSVSGTFSFDVPSTTPNAGTYSASVTFTPDDNVNYTTVSGTVDVTVDQATPTVTDWPTASSITYGEALSASVLTGGTSSVSGTFSFDVPSTTPNAGTYSASVTFTPDDNVNYTTVSGTVDVTVDQAIPTVTDWPTASSITYGEALSASVLTGGTSSVSGTFSFDVPSTTPNAGTYSASVTFTPDDNVNYTTVSGTVDVTVDQAIPTVTDWPTASSITYGEALSASVLTGGTSSVSGTFSFDVPSTTPNAGTYSASVTFTPDDNVNYTTVSGTVDVTVDQAIPTVTDWPTASSITYGEALSASVLTGGTSSVSGTFSFDVPSTTPNAGTYSASVTFTPDDNVNYTTVSGTVDVTVDQAIPTVTDWPTASSITYGEALSASVLTGGTSSVSGTFSFDVPSTTPNAGTYSASVTFTPDDNVNYTTVSGTVDVTVDQAEQIITWDQDVSELEIGSVITLNASSNSGLTIEYSSDNPEVAVVTGNSLEIISSGFATITASQSGNENYLPADNVDKELDIPVGLHDTQREVLVDLYPVPAHNILTIELTIEDNYNLRIFDVQGRLIKDGEMSGKFMRLDVNHLNPGTYFIEIESNDFFYKQAWLKH